MAGHCPFQLRSHSDFCGLVPGLPREAVNVDVIASSLTRFLGESTSYQSVSHIVFNAFSNNAESHSVAGPADPSVPWTESLADGISTVFRASEFDSMDHKKAYTSHK